MTQGQRCRALAPLLPRPPGGTLRLPAWTHSSPTALPPPPHHPVLCSRLLCGDSPRVAPTLSRTPHQVASVLPPGGHISPLPLPGAQPMERVAWPVGGWGDKCSDHMYPNNQSKKRRGWEGPSWWGHHYSEEECARSSILRQVPSVPGRRLCSPHLGTQPDPCPRGHGLAPQEPCVVSAPSPHLRPWAEVWPRGGDWVPTPGILGTGQASRPWAQGRKEGPWLAACPER